ncbi:hypothetical protein [Citrobacter koseri]|uniref:hypothetical protein n=1 Tax=Citrobacter koseri TaxID=545 RepID=UPI001904E8EC|nr:hypothetical protein [Citrobacter koseri]MBJ9010647.1 hypothetical protein [Citrobacter koseri]
MAKVTFLDELAKIYTEKKRSQGERAYSVYKNKSDSLHWSQVVEARNRKVMRKIRRSAGKSNRLDGRATAYGRVAAMSEVDMWAKICRTNRRLGGLNDQ